MLMKITTRIIQRIAILAFFAGFAGSAMAQDDIIKLNTLSNLFDGVIFDHAMHVEASPGCETCHHHTTGTPASDGKCALCHGSDRGNAAANPAVACRDCHLEQPFSAENIRVKEGQRILYHADQPGLKAAYHLGCLGCHAEAGAPTGCSDCHPRNATGDAFYNAGTFAPKERQTKHQ
jgi:hypothetical protein